LSLLLMKFKILALSAFLAIAVSSAPSTLAAAGINWVQVSETMSVLHGQEIGTKADVFFEKLSDKRGNVTVLLFLIAIRRWIVFFHLNSRSCRRQVPYLQ
jgi:hypothetical protein